MIDKQKIEYFLINRLRKVSHEVKNLKMNSKDHKEKSIVMDVYKDLFDRVLEGSFDYEYSGLETLIKGFDEYINK